MKNWNEMTKEERENMASDIWTQVDPKKVFVDYVMSFYGPKGIYEFDFEVNEVIEAIEDRLNNKRYIDLPFDGDSVDREIVRDIVFAKRSKRLSLFKAGRSSMV